MPPKYDVWSEIRKLGLEEMKYDAWSEIRKRPGFFSTDASQKTSEEDKCAEDVRVGASTVCVCEGGGCFQCPRVALQVRD